MIVVIILLKFEIALKKSENPRNLIKNLLNQYICKTWDYLSQDLEHKQDCVHQVLAITNVNEVPRIR